MSRIKIARLTYKNFYSDCIVQPLPILSDCATRLTNEHFQFVNCLGRDARGGDASEGSATRIRRVRTIIILIALNVVE